MLKWEWYDNSNTKSLFIHLLLTVSLNDSSWHGVEVKRGSRISSLSKLSLETGLTIRQIRTAINNLKSTGEITTNAQCGKFTLFTVNNYDKYQLEASLRQTDGTDTTESRQVSGNQMTNQRQQYNKVKESKEGKEIMRSKEYCAATDCTKNNIENFSEPTEYPSFSEVQAYIAETGGGVDPLRFYAFYNERGWTTTSGQPITDWQSLVKHWRTTERPMYNKKKEIPESPMADAYRSLVYNIDE